MEQKNKETREQAGARASEQAGEKTREHVGTSASKHMTQRTNEPVSERVNERTNQRTLGAGLLMRLLAGDRTRWLMLRRACCCVFWFHGWLVSFAGSLVPLFRHLLVLVFVGSLAPALAHAQTPHTLIVSLRDVRGVGIAGATITVRDEPGTSDRAQATTDPQGQATLSNLTMDIVRVVVSGSLADGTPLSQPGQDARGIWLMLDAPLVQLDLRSELNGVILPDPATMISADLPIPATPMAPQPTSTPTSPTAVVQVPTALPIDLHPPDRAPLRPVDLGRGLVIIGTLILILLLAGWLVQGRRASR